MLSFDKMQTGTKQTSEVSKFYEGKSVFITGAAGFLGMVILETLLRCCPGICKIFILLRSKNGLQPEDRKERIFNKRIFNKLKQDDPTVLNKVVVVPGDISQENFGMNEDSLLEITGEVTIVFHIAASISMFKPLSYMVKQNVEGTDNVIDFCHKLRKLEALVYSSSLYSNSNRTDIDEKIYKMPFKAEKVVELSRKGDIDGLNGLFSSCKPQFLTFYIFTKCLSENLLADKACDLPVVIVRPSVIICCMNGPTPGYIASETSIVNVGSAIGKGVIRVLRCNENVQFEFITADVAANTHIVTAYLQARKSLPSPSIYNCTSGDLISCKDMFVSIYNMIKKYPLPNTYLIPSLILCSSPTLYAFYSSLFHYLPAVLIDILLWLRGSKLRLFKIYKMYDTLVDTAFTIQTIPWNFGCENFQSLPERLNPIDAKIFCVDLKDFTLEKFITSLRHGWPNYWVNNKLYEENIWRTSLRYFLTYLIRCSVLGGIALVCYTALF